MSIKKKLLAYVMTIAMVLAITVCSAFACTMLYVGSDLTETGDTYMSRSEDYSNSYNKVAYVSEHGKHPAGSTYEGCYFSFTFTHDSYAYTAVSDDNLVGTGNPDGECPNCGKTHEHTPMEEGGCNEMGLCVSAMDSVYANKLVTGVDPYKSGRKGDTNYMNEGDMNTVLLGECATAKEAVELLCSIYDEYGVCEGSGLQISDQNETWYVENYSGTQYIAIKLSSETVAFNANVGIIGLVDLDDTENVIASSKVIEVAKEAGSFVGNEEENQIDYRASYASLGLNSRVWNGLNYLCGVDTFTKETTTPDDITITNVKDNEIVPVYSNIQLKGKLTTKDMIDFYKVQDIGKAGNLEEHIFQISAEGETATSIIEWQGINHGGYTVFVPYYPVLTTDVYEGYKVGGIGGVKFSAETPEDLYGSYLATSRGKTGYSVYPAGWENGYYWSIDLLSNYCDSSACSAEDKAMVKSVLAQMQQKCYDKAAEMEKAVATMSTDEAKVYCTASSAELAKEAHELYVALYKHVIYGHDWSKGVCTVCGDVAPAIDTPVVTEVTNTAKGNVKLTWNAVEGAASYDVYRSDSSDGEYVKMFSTGNTAYTNISSVAGKTFFYKVVAVAAKDDASDSEASEAVSGMIKCLAPVVKVSNNEQGFVSLSWDAVKGAKQYVIYRASSADGEFVKMYTTKGTCYNNTKATAGVTYQYKVVAVCGNDAVADAESAVVLGTCKCAAPAVSKVAGKAQPTIKWDAVKGAQKYVVYYSVNGGEFTKLFTTAKTSFTNISAKAGSTYTYKVVAVTFNPDVCSVFSNSVKYKL